MEMRGRGNRPMTGTPGTPGLLDGANSSPQDRLEGLKAERAFAIVVTPRDSWHRRNTRD
jgi:hypothetical protein